jgi:uncharacterized protein
MSARPPDGPLLWNVAGLLGDDVGAQRTFAIEDVTIDLPDGLTLADPINGQVRFLRTNRGILADATLSSALAAECARCLRPVRVPIDLVLSEEYLPSLDLATGTPVPVDDEPDTLQLTDHHELDLEGPVRDAIILAEPIAPLDRPDCPGLCIVCGQPLDEGVHDHPDDEIDPRLEALRAFRADEP